jgi:hypothetical protein
MCTEVTLCTPVTVARKETYGLPHGASWSRASGGHNSQLQSYSYMRERVDLAASTSGVTLTSPAAARSRWPATAARAIELARTRFHACMRQLPRRVRAARAAASRGRVSVAARSAVLLAIAKSYTANPCLLVTTVVTN